MSKPKGKAKGPQLAPAWELNTRDGIRRERERVLGQGCRAKPGGGGTIEEPEDTSLRTQSGGRVPDDAIVVGRSYSVLVLL